MLNVLPWSNVTGSAGRPVAGRIATGHAAGTPEALKCRSSSRSRSRPFDMPATATWPPSGRTPQTTAPFQPLSARADQVMAGIADPDAVGRECDRARRLDGVEQYRHADRDDRREQQRRKKAFHGASLTFTSPEPIIRPP